LWYCISIRTNFTTIRKTTQIFFVNELSNHLKALIGDKDSEVIFVNLYSLLVKILFSGKE